MDEPQLASQNDNPTAKTTKRLKATLITTNAILMSLGYVGGSLVSRLYFLHGGHRHWLSSFLETAGFPILLLPISFSYLHRRRRSRQRSPAVSMTPRILAACAALGVMTGADDFLYAYGLSFLPVSTSAEHDSSCARKAVSPSGNTTSRILPIFLAPKRLQGPG